MVARKIERFEGLKRINVEEIDSKQRMDHFRLHKMILWWCCAFNSDKHDKTVCFLLCSNMINVWIVYFFFFCGLFSFSLSIYLSLRKFWFWQLFFLLLLTLVCSLVPKTNAFKNLFAMTPSTFFLLSQGEMECGARKN